MKVGIAGSRSLCVPNIGDYLPPETTMILSGGARGVDTCAREYALAHRLPLREFRPDYRRFGRGAPLRRNDELIAAADRMLVFWDGTSHGTRYVIDRCRALGVPLTLVRL